MDKVYKSKREYDSAVSRIRNMETAFDRAEEAVSALNKALEAYRQSADDIRMLSEYYGSEDWKRDFRADENGELPSDLKRGVLSEDGIWEFLDENRVLTEHLRDIAEANIK